ncbi:MAG: hypothetical protein FWF44_10270 [Defluviitaleaceae bacterium]|nr:hypothetical protein [Defluviitaleaceae bacterium]
MGLQTRASTELEMARAGVPIHPFEGLSMPNEKRNYPDFFTGHEEK